MATTPTDGMSHPTVVPENFEPKTVEESEGTERANGDDG
jgi:hypothetical protein